VGEIPESFDTTSVALPESGINDFLSVIPHCIIARNIERVVADCSSFKSLPINPNLPQNEF